VIHGYARVSTDGQSVDAQVRQLKASGALKVWRTEICGPTGDAGTKTMRLSKPTTHLGGRSSSPASAARAAGMGSSA
jgi:hypothetical protein